VAVVSQERQENFGYAIFLSPNYHTMNSILEEVKARKRLFIPLICIVFVHVLFLANKWYTFSYYSSDWMTAHQYDRYIQNGRTAASKEVYLLYFKLLPYWTINLIYGAYFVLAVIAVKYKEKKGSLTWAQKALAVSRIRKEAIKKAETAKKEQP